MGREGVKWARDLVSVRNVGRCGLLEGSSSGLHEQPENDHYQVLKHVVVPYVGNTLYSTNKYSCVRQVHTLNIGYFIEHNGDDEPNDWCWMIVR